MTKRNWERVEKERRLQRAIADPPFPGSVSSWSSIADRRGVACRCRKPDRTNHEQPNQAVGSKCQTCRQHESANQEAPQTQHPSTQSQSATRPKQKKKRRQYTITGAIPEGWFPSGRNLSTRVVKTLDRGSKVWLWWCPKCRLVDVGFATKTDATKSSRLHVCDLTCAVDRAAKPTEGLSTPQGTPAEEPVRLIRSTGTRRSSQDRKAGPAQGSRGGSQRTARAQGSKPAQTTSRPNPAR